jgi:dTDP-4-dehydrorhamnose reductase
MKFLLTGAAGQLGQALRQQGAVGLELIPTSRSGDPATGLMPLDLAHAASCRAAVIEHEPDWVLGSLDKNFVLTMLRLHHVRGASASTCASSWWE